MLFTWGANSYGQLGTGDTLDRFQPVSIFGSTLSVIAGGGGHSIVSTGQHTFGCGSHLTGQIGASSDPLCFQSINLNTSQPIKSVACGWDFTLFLTNDEQLFGLGSNAHGQLCTSSVPFTVEPFRVFLPTVRMVSAGLRHAVAISAVDDSVLSWGANRRGQLGASLPGITSSANFIRFNFDPSFGKPICCSAGAHHSAILTEGGHVLVFGDLRYFRGAVALDEPRTAGESPRLSFPPYLFGSRPLVRIVSGWSHLVGLTDTGEVYTWGRADLGQLGRPTPLTNSYDVSIVPQYDPTPGRVTFGEPGAAPTVKIVDIAAGSEHSMALDEDGLIWAWGWNEHGMCGVSSTPEVDAAGSHSPAHDRCIQLPTCVKIPPYNTHQSLKETKALAIGAGYGHSLAYIC